LVHAQQPFQGRVVYTVRVANEKEVPEFTVLYSPNKIKIKFKEKQEYEKEYLLIDLDSGKLFTVNTGTKTFHSKNLTQVNTKEAPVTKTIAGYQTSSVTLKNPGTGNLFGGLSSGTTVLFAAPDLYFPVPEKYGDIPELILIQNNHIVLGAELKIANGEMAEDMPDSLQQQMKIDIEATGVYPEVFNIAEFSIPADFTKQTHWMGSDTVAVAMDTVSMEEWPPVPPPPPKKKTGSKPTTPKKTTPQKGEATKPKKSPNKR
ncbi:MAG: hypothetical protein ACJ749_05530, partial [Flavisolibacter sp.]